MQHAACPGVHATFVEPLAELRHLAAGTGVQPQINRREGPPARVHANQAVQERGGCHGDDLSRVAGQHLVDRRAHAVEQRLGGELAATVRGNSRCVGEMRCSPGDRPCAGPIGRSTTRAPSPSTWSSSATDASRSRNDSSAVGEMCSPSKSHVSSYQRLKEWMLAYATLVSSM